MLQPQKTCTKCRLAKELAKFKRVKRRPSGLGSICKACHAEAERVRCKRIQEQRRVDARKYYEANRDAVLSRQRARYAAVSEVRSRVAEASKSWQTANPNATRAASRKWKRANPEKTREACRRYKKRRPDIVNANVQLRRARKLNADIQHVTASMLLARASVFGHACAYCGGPHEHWDHVVPIARGGKHCLSNLRPACSHCNLSKGAKALAEWLALKKAA